MHPEPTFFKGITMSLGEKNCLPAEVIRAKEEEKREAERIKVWEVPLILVLLPLYLAWKAVRFAGILVLCVIGAIVQTTACIVILRK
ncbi:MAG TPA: hypothetical protein IAB01_05745 [Candidatus Avidesulfovibrio excrementigallinarum]|nr:hypothetical protein [Candidatus Avidesulfovibrio excrementigallinarum]